MIKRAGRDIYQSPGRFVGAIGLGSGALVKGGLLARNVGGFDQTFSAYPSGNLAPAAFILPIKDGAIASRGLSEGEITADADLIPARNLVASASLTITVTDAQLDQIVSAVASGTLTISATNAQLAAAAGMTATGTMTLSTTDAQLGAIFSVTADGTMTITATDAFLTALAHMEAEAGGPTPLSPEGLADAVWDEILAEHLDAGSTGAALSDAGGAGNPWSALLSANNDPDTFGERVQKLLTVAKFLGLK